MSTLQEIGLKHGTDKACFHEYCNFYDEKFNHIKNENLKFLEIGVWKSYSMKMWLEYFQNSEIHGIDYIPNTVPDGAIFHQVNCENEFELENFAKNNNDWDIIIDDGGHTMLQQQLAFKHLWKTVKPGRYFVIEDLHTSFLPYLKRCNNENLPTTYEMLMALQNGTYFENKFITNDFINQTRKEIASIEIWCKNKNDYSNSVTALITKIH